MLDDAGYGASARTLAIDGGPFYDKYSTRMRKEIIPSAPCASAVYLLAKKRTHIERRPGVGECRTARWKADTMVYILDQSYIGTMARHVPVVRN